MSAILAGPMAATALFIPREVTLTVTGVVFPAASTTTIHHTAILTILAVDTVTVCNAPHTSSAVESRSSKSPESLPPTISITPIPRPTSSDEPTRTLAPSAGGAVLGLTSVDKLPTAPASSIASSKRTGTTTATIITTTTTTVPGTKTTVVAKPSSGSEDRDMYPYPSKSSEVPEPKKAEEKDNGCPYYYPDGSPGC